MTDDDALVALLAELVATDSVNPGLDASGAGEAAIAARIDARARARDLRVSRHGPAERPSLIVETTRGGPGPTLLLCGHLDTVGHGSMDDPVTPRIENERMYGRGTYDMEGGLAAALVAAARCNRAEHPGRVAVAAVADEENLSAGALDVLDALRELAPVACVVTEPTELAVARAHRGFVWADVTVHGVAAHGSRPHLGVDAIVAAGPILTGLADLQHRLSTAPHPLLGPGTVHASLIRGGIEESTIPDHCALVVERRTIPGESAAQVLGEIEELLEAARRVTPQARFEASVRLERDPMETPADAPLVRAALDARQRATGRAGQAEGASYWADSALISAAGIPTVLLGPAGEGAHAQVEWVELESVRQLAAILTDLAASLG